ncbi:hypothetical protein FA15DRAFT_731606 [Coprinopsis marcescibilis]|uniref:Uncharacterized protein n=1 Tax=Coprinopsis marcescibilis TaxID=230819 RepID=A0A5C3KEA5_COPMA|nr:hypothetical protein FA15DRAFT_731606 [Coprinopsis marcescibilis]
MPLQPPPEVASHYTGEQFQFKVYYLLCFWVESLLYGVYFTMFIAALNIMLRKRTLNTMPSKIFLAGSFSLFVLITIHNFLNIYRMLKAYAYETSYAYPVTFLRSMNNWDCFAFPLILALIIWIADILVIYRCWLIWKKNYWVILLPILLLLGNVVAQGANMAWFGNRNRNSIPVDRGYMYWMLRLNFPLAFCQNILTTGLIAYKIWKQHHETRQAGMTVSGGVNLLSVVRIMIESAFLYTSILLVLIILQFSHPSGVILQHALVPLTGIVFLLIAIRAHAARSEKSGFTSAANGSMIPSWVRGDFESKGRSGRHSGTMPTVTTVTEEHRLEDFTDVKFRSEKTTIDGSLNGSKDGKLHVV